MLLNVILVLRKVLVINFAIMTDVEKYIELTGQSQQELFGGSIAVGMTFIINELVPKALKEKKKIVWHYGDPFNGIGSLSYSFEDI